MVMAPFARSRAFATALVAVCGIPWAISSWAPFAFMGVEINKLAIDPSQNARYSGVTMITSSSIRTGNYVDPNADAEMDVLRLNHNHNHHHHHYHHNHHPVDPDDDLASDSDSDSDSNDDPSSTGELAGIYLGVLNVYTTLPQFVGTFISWIVFSVLEPASTKRNETSPDAMWMNLDQNSPNAISVCLFIGALSALVASEATRRMRYAR